MSCHIPVWVSSGESVPASEHVSDALFSDHILVSQIEPDDNVCAVLMRPDQAAAVSLRVNGYDVPFPGVRPLRHGDQVCVDGRELWVSIDAAPDHDSYDPERHGTPAYCALTRAALRPGDAIVVCRGTPDRDCGLLYSADAWATGVPCPDCGATADAAPWSPPTASSQGSMDALSRLLDGPHGRAVSQET